MTGWILRILNIKVGLIGAVLLALAIVSPAQSAEAFRNLKIGELAPSFKLKTTGGEEAEYTPPPGKPVLIAFLRMNQDKSEAVLKDLASKLTPDVVSKIEMLVILVNVSEGDPAEWVKKMGTELPVLVDVGDEVYGKFGVMVAPQTAILNSEGILKEEFNGHTSDYPAIAESALRTVLGMEQIKDESIAVASNLPDERKRAMREVQNAKMFKERKMKSKALPQAKKAVETDPSYPEAQVLVGELLLDEGGDENLVEAEKHFTKALELEPNSVMAKVGNARIQAKKGNVAAAEESLEKAAAMSPHAGKIYYYLGDIYEKAGDFQKASASYRKALDRMIIE